jgi:hypothetical protein
MEKVSRVYSKHDVDFKWVKDITHIHKMKDVMCLRNWIKRIANR